MIHVLDIVMYVVLIFALRPILPPDWRDELGGCAALTIYTIVYVILFWFFFDWSEIFASIGLYFDGLNLTW